MNDDTKKVRWWLWWPGLFLLWLATGGLLTMGYTLNGALLDTPFWLFGILVGLVVFLGTVCWAIFTLAMALAALKGTFSLVFLRRSPPASTFGPTPRP